MRATVLVLLMGLLAGCGAVATVPPPTATVVPVPTATSTPMPTATASAMSMADAQAYTCKTVMGQPSSCVQQEEASLGIATQRILLAEMPPDSALTPAAAAQDRANVTTLTANAMDLFGALASAIETSCGMTDAQAATDIAQLANAMAAPQGSYDLRLIDNHLQAILTMHQRDGASCPGAFAYFEGGLAAPPIPPRPTAAR